MAITINGVNSEEKAYLTKEIRVSGDKVSLIFDPMITSSGKGL
jgi:thymidine phosphorylase